ncbi:bifunctional deaminase-reductase, C-terminal [Stappia aggregata IAM 12614]|uniref:Bifunctional deaminase-reductase, C-terminal n=1 Tax=Roseibium aggregatum (strain ATCC 25650 / DSM 13394 / JCM 20685 / NBRC 16684 / NCIMB 2208 / IAM 12614 / B1) TaxID=384765 RepID=A0NQB6_ROSAI|nr:dihydrofolate reductase family protein [Roseibium aggregatum]EAV44974.1 bifunctional deaminase-reductase, C-terminal [Stappia aggregata IAM 12614] [Roseibium aggregatum IAM 12614]
MITGHVFIATSLDGFIARSDGDIAWLLERDDPAEDHGYDDFIADIDVIMMGRGTFEKMRAVRPWPYHRPVVVLSSTLTRSDLSEDLLDKVRVANFSPEEAMRMLQSEGHRKVYIDGGLLIQSFLKAGLIADMVITSVPVLLGEGRRLFGSIPADISLRHEQTKSFPSGLVQSHYRIEA